ncbi:MULTISPECIES: hypothetical protein [unclassified Streptomyces]|uniref:hypothetical protein n=1 Tax=unclassified Streptomyces TaxID=2593676 RepID=UPI000CD5884F|nr:MULTISPECIES: hypothetical protein [unclassified Streptomyces]
MSSVRRVRRTTTALSAVVCAALVLGACGAGDDGTDTADDTPPGVDQSEPADDTDGDADEQDEPEPEDEEDDDRPEIDLGNDFENIYEDDATGDDVKDAILRDSRGYFDAVDAAIIHQNVEHPALSYYITGDAFTRTIDVLDRVIDGNRVPTGSARIFNREVTTFDSESAAVSFCRDFSAVANVDKDTGEVGSPMDEDAKATHYTTRLELSDQGVWQTVDYQVVGEASECA